MVITGNFIVPNSMLFGGGMVIGIACFFVLGYKQPDIEKKLQEDKA